MHSSPHCSSISPYFHMVPYININKDFSLIFMIIKYTNFFVLCIYRIFFFSLHCVHFYFSQLDFGCFKLLSSLNISSCHIFLARTLDLLFSNVVYFICLKHIILYLLKICWVLHPDFYFSLYLSLSY